MGSRSSNSVSIGHATYSSHSGDLSVHVAFTCDVAESDVMY